MSRKVKEFIEIRDYASLDVLIGKLIEVRDSLPADAGAQVKMKGDDIFGRQLSVAYFRPQTADEAACDARYDAAYRQARKEQAAAASDRPQRRLRAA